jgi:HNH endonuclease
MEMCSAVGVNLQRGMNYRLRGDESVILMSVRLGAPYADRVEDEGRILIYEGHDCAKTANVPDPKRIDQPAHNPGGSLTQNGLFAESVRRYKEGKTPPEKVRVYEKIRSGIWVYNGTFELIDCWTETSGERRTFKFELRFSGADDHLASTTTESTLLDDDRLIPSWVKLEVWKRDQGKCRKCGTSAGLHFDHIIPYSKGGSSKDPANIQILCGRHNLQKRDNIE